MKPMTMRERMLALVQGREMDRVPFVQYDGLVPTDELWALVGRENVGLLRWTLAHRTEHPHCRFVTEEIAVNGTRSQRTTLHTPEGHLVQEKLIEPTYGTGSTKKHFVKDPEDYRILLSFLRDITIHEDFNSLLTNIKELGEDGLPHTYVLRTPFQQLWIEWVCLEDLCLHMVQIPEIMEEVTDLLGEILRRIFHVIQNAPMPYVVFGDNITAPVIGEHYFRRYCLPYYNELADLLAERNIPVAVHMDGDLKPLWPAIGESKVSLLDSFSPPPDNDTRPADAIAMWPEKKLMINFPSSVHLAAPEVIHRRTQGILEEAGHSGRLQIQLSENVPPFAWRTSCPEIVRAIREFGKP